MRETMRQIMAGVQHAGRPEKVAYCTYKYERPDGAIAWRYHHTDIVVKHPSGEWELNSGGWRTSTTKSKLNEFAPVRLHQHKGEWLVNLRETGGGQDIATPRFYTVPFWDGMRISPEGHVIGYKPEKIEGQLKARAKLGRQINKFARLICDTERYPEIPMPNGGDCWCCMMFDRAKLKDTSGAFNCSNQDALGQPGEDTSHLLSHIKEGYYHGALIVNALQWAGYKDVAFILHTNYRDLIARAVRRYLRRKLGLAA